MAATSIGQNPRAAPRLDPIVSQANAKRLLFAFLASEPRCQQLVVEALGNVLCVNLRAVVSDVYSGVENVHRLIPSLDICNEIVDEIDLDSPFLPSHLADKIVKNFLVCYVAPIRREGIAKIGSRLRHEHRLNAESARNPDKYP